MSYNEKHNEANGEENNDGHGDNRSWNCGVEGPTDDKEITNLRDRQRRNFIATLLLSAGVPMLSGGDELGKTQLGNNNAYCQDNELNWYNWELSEKHRIFLKFVRRLIHFRHSQPVLQRRKFLTGTPHPENGVKDIAWYHPSGREMNGSDWESAEVKAFAVCYSGKRHHRERRTG